MTDFIDVTENHIILGDNLEALGKIPDESIQMIYIDPPFNTGKVQKLTTKTMVESTSGDRTGFGGKRYKTVDGKTISYADTFTDFIEFLAPRLEEAHRILKDTGTIYIHLDYREVHYVKVYMDTLFGRDSFLNEIIWAYDYGAKSKRKWPAKHDNILVYVKNPKTYFFDSIEVDREPYMAPGLVSKEKAEKVSYPPQCGGTLSYQQIARNVPGTLHKNQKVSFGVWSRRAAALVILFLTSLLEVEL